jgi:outer membrane protein OmpA-like peptidoglycan-associated protein
MKRWRSHAATAAARPLLAATDPIGRVGVVFFEHGSYALRAAYRNVLRTQARRLELATEMRPLLVRGFANHTAGDASARALALRRALEVAGVLQQLGVPSEALQVCGPGLCGPDPDGGGAIWRRSFNRRVELLVPVPAPGRAAATPPTGTRRRRRAGTGPAGRQSARRGVSTSSWSPASMVA